MLSKEELKKLYVLANEFKEGDESLGGTKDENKKKEAREQISNLTIGDITSINLVDDELTKALKSDLDTEKIKEIENVTIKEFKKIILSENCSKWVENYRMALSSEVVAGVVKIMTNEELSKVSLSLYNPIIENENNINENEENIFIGSKMHFGSRIQPNSPGDDPDEILFHTLEGIVHGCGDVIIGLNPSCDNVEDIARSEDVLSRIIERLKLPTRFSVLSDMVKQTKAKDISNVDVGFQSLAGTSKALVGYIGMDVDGYVNLSKNFKGLYFETGQGSEVTNHLEEGIDMVTLESRCYGLARHIKKKTNMKWMIVNDVSGFIGPEVYKNSSQLYRACLEDLVMAKIQGITMGLDVCSTFHMGIHPFELENLTVKIVEKGAPAFLMAVAGKADPMLGYLTTAIKEHPRLRKYFNKKISTPMFKRLHELGILDAEGNLLFNDEEALCEMYALYCEGNSKLVQENKEEIKSSEMHVQFKKEAKEQIKKMKLKGFNIANGMNGDIEDTKEERERLKNIYEVSVKALRAEIDFNILKNFLNDDYILVKSKSTDRDDYISHPESGEELSEEGKLAVQNLIKEKCNKTKNVLFVISDGLNANAINEHLQYILPQLKKMLKDNNITFYNKDIVVINGRVRLGYQIGDLADVDMIVHFIGERPGTGLDQMSVYLTYGKQNDSAKPRKWNKNMDHCLTTAVCGIHPKGKTIKEATDEVINVIKNGIKYKITGVGLTELIRV